MAKMPETQARPVSWWWKIQYMAGLGWLVCRESCGETVPHSGHIRATLAEAQVELREAWAEQTAELTKDIREEYAQ